MHSQKLWMRWIDCTWTVPHWAPFNLELILRANSSRQARSRITDVDIAEETTEFASKQILVQAGTQMLREANNLPRTALELLR